MAIQIPSNGPGVDVSLVRQIKRFKILTLVLVLVLAVGIAAFLIVRHLGQPVAILLDGRSITNVRSAAVADRLLAEAEVAKVGGAYPENTIVRLQKVQFQRLSSGVRLDPNRVAQSKLRNALRLNVHAYAILVNGHVSIGLPSDEIATETLHRVKEHYAQLPPNAEILGEPEIVQKVVVKSRAISASAARSSAEAAAPYFWTPPASRTYVVRRGDTGLGIARRHHLSLTDFIIANTGRNINRLAPGTLVNVQKMPLLLTVRVQKQFTREEKVLENAPAADAGLQRVTYKVTYINGQETQRDPIGIETLDPPQARTSL